MSLRKFFKLAVKVRPVHDNMRQDDYITQSFPVLRKGSMFSLFDGKDIGVLRCKLTSASLRMEERIEMRSNSVEMQYDLSVLSPQSSVCVYQYPTDENAKAKKTKIEVAQPQTRIRNGDVVTLPLYLAKMQKQHSVLQALNIDIEETPQDNLGDEEILKQLKQANILVPAIPSELQQSDTVITEWNGISTTDEDVEKNLSLYLKLKPLVAYSDESLCVQNKPAGLMVHDGDSSTSKLTVDKYMEALAHISSGCLKALLFLNSTLASSNAVDCGEQTEEHLKLIAKQSTAPFSAHTFKKQLEIAEKDKALLSCTAPKLVHRLDKPTSGVLFLGKTRQASQLLTEQFKSKSDDAVNNTQISTMSKTYIATVPSITHVPTSEYVQILIPGKSWMVKIPLKNPENQSQQHTAMTRVTILSSHNGIDHVECEPVTGRKHQIRLHLAALGYPIFGESLYTSKEACYERVGKHIYIPAFKTKDVKALHLACTRISLQHPLFLDTSTDHSEKLAQLCQSLQAPGAQGMLTVEVALPAHMKHPTMYTNTRVALR